MNGRKICSFWGVFWILIICTILSSNIQRQMTIKVKVLEPKLSMAEDSMEAYSTEILCGGDLYEAVGGSEWEVGLRAKLVPPEFYITEEGQVRLFSNTGDSKILYRTKELYSGAVVQKTTTYQGKDGFYLIVSPEKEPKLLAIKEEEPFMENLQKVNLGLLPEERLYSMAELEKFSNSFILLGLLLSLVIVTLLICLYSWKLAGYVQENKKTLLVNNGMLSLILFGIYKSAYTIELPSSLLPRENIFDWLHYKTEFGEILNALELLSSETAVSILKNFYHNLLLGVFVMIVVIVGGCVFICVEMYINN